MGFVSKNRMSFFTVGMLVLIGVGLLSPRWVSAQPAEADQPKPVEWHLSEPIVKDVAEVPAFLSGSTRTTLNEIKPAVEELMGPLIEAVQNGDATFMGAPIFIYQGATGQPDVPFDMTIGFPATDADVAVPGYANKPLAPFRCVSFYYTGPMEGLPAAYGKLMPQVFQAGHMPSGVSRELYLFWETEDSPNNIVEIQIGIAGGEPEI